MYAAHYGLGNGKSPVAPEVQRLVVADADDLRVAFEETPHHILTEGPQFGNFLDCEMPLKSLPVGQS